MNAARQTAQSWEHQVEVGSVQLAGAPESTLEAAPQQAQRVQDRTVSVCILCCSFLECSAVDYAAPSQAHVARRPVGETEGRMPRSIVSVSHRPLTLTPTPASIPQDASHSWTASIPTVNVAGSPTVSLQSSNRLSIRAYHNIGGSTHLPARLSSHSNRLLHPRCDYAFVCSLLPAIRILSHHCIDRGLDEHTEDLIASQQQQVLHMI